MNSSGRAPSSPPLIPFDPDNLFANQSHFGDNVSVDGEWLAITASLRNGGRGVVFIYRLVNGEWTFSQELRSTMPASRRFGTSAMLSGGEFLAVGQRDNFAQLNNLPSVHTYRLVGDTWILDGVITDPTFHSGSVVDHFGSTLALAPDGQTLVVPDQHGCPGGFMSPILGEAYVFERNLEDLEPTWELVATLAPTDNFHLEPCLAISPKFGFSIQLDRNAVFIGMPFGHGLLEGSEQGTVYRFDRSNGGEWRPTETTRFVGELEEGQDVGTLVGGSIAYDGGTLFSGPILGVGGVRVFEINAGDVICRFSESTPTLEALRPTNQNGLTLALHGLPPGAPVQLLCSTQHSTVPGSAATGALCLGGSIRRTVA